MTFVPFILKTLYFQNIYVLHKSEAYTIARDQLLTFVIQYIDAFNSFSRKFLRWENKRVSYLENVGNSRTYRHK